MKTRTVQSSEVVRNRRVDAGHFLAPGISAKATITAASHRGVELVSLGGEGGLAEVSLPKRFKRAYARSSADGVPYVRPYDLLEFLPEPAAFLSRSGNDIEAYSVHEGTILQTCSGRNLGPAVYVDKYLSRFVVSHDMVRIRVLDERMRMYVLAFLACQSGQALLRLDKTGSVVDHIDDSQVAAQSVPVLNEVIDEVVALMEEATSTRERARLGLSEAQAQFNQQLEDLPEVRSSDGWTVSARSLGGRIDAANHHPVSQAAREVSLRLGGVTVGEIAQVQKPAGRYKTVYVDREWGRPILSGRQVHQVHPVGLKFIAPTALRNPSRYELPVHAIAYQADGRAEQKLGVPVMITEDRRGWMASGHVGRVIASPGVDPGWLFLALRSEHARIQIKSRASGSVVDGSYEEDMERVVLPPPARHPEVVELWELFREASLREQRAASLIEGALIKRSEESASEATAALRGADGR